jgi:hypothetical protein
MVVLAINPAFRSNRGSIKKLEEDVTPGFVVSLDFNSLYGARRERIGCPLPSFTGIFRWFG